MLALKIVAILLGLAFGVFGYFIYFQKKYFLVNGFAEDVRSKKKTERYAKTVGLVEVILGIGCLLAGIALMIFA